MTEGENLPEALDNARDCLETMIAYSIRKNQDIPVPSPLRGRRVIMPETNLALKAAL